MNRTIIRYRLIEMSIPSLLLYILILASCAHVIVLDVVPHDADIKINNREYISKEEFKTKERNIYVSINKDGYIPVETELANISGKNNVYNFRLEKIKYPLHIKMLSQNTEAHLLLNCNGKNIKGSEINQTIENGNYSLFLISNNERLSIPVTVDQKISMLIRDPEIRNNIRNIELTPEGLYTCGSQPKQVNISPDSSCAYITLLNGTGFQIFDIKRKKIINTISPGTDGKKKGFVEGCFIPDLNTYLVSQMTTGKVYEYDVSNCRKPELRRVLNTRGKWSKVVAYNDELGIIAVSNWLSNTISLISYESGKILKQIDEISVPRGIIFSGKGDFFYAASYNDGTVTKYRTKDWKKITEIKIEDSAMRHLALTQDDSTLYASAMGIGKIYRIDTKSFKVTKSFSGFTNPNTIKLTPDNKYLAVSSRGKNNPEGYLFKSKEPGFVTLLDLHGKNKKCVIKGGLQPTGLDISPDGSFFIFSNFQDDTIEIYRFREYP